MKKTKLLKTMTTLAMSTAMLLSATLAFAETKQTTEDSIAIMPEVDENGFVINDGVLISYLGTAAEIVIPDGVTSIGYAAFQDDSNITKVTIPDGVTGIGYSAFSGCSSLKEVDIPDSVTEIEDWAFYRCSSLTKVTIPKGITVIAGGAFSGCSSLTEVTIPEGVTHIAWNAFENCSSLTEVTIPSSVTFIGGEAFIGTKWLENKQKENPLVIVNHILIDGTTASGKVTIPEDVTSIGGNAFFGSSSVTELLIPASVMNMNDHAFSGCSSLMKVTIQEGVTEIRWYLFDGCSSLEEVIIPASVTYIGYHAFSGTKWLENKQKENPLVIVNHILIDATTAGEKVTIPEGVTSIEYGAFEGCSSLTEVTIPASVQYIEDEWVFEDCWKKLTIYGVAGSYAETYAKENDIPFVAILESSSAIDKEGTNSTYTKGSSEGATIKCLWDLADFVNVYVDGTLIDKANYTLEEGSTIITFTQSFMDTLSAGEHVFTLEYTGNRKVEVSMTIAEAEKKQAEKSQADGSTKTGDTSNMFLWIMLALSSAGCVLSVRKKLRTS